MVMCRFTDRLATGEWICKLCGRASRSRRDVAPARVCAAFSLEIIGHPKPCPMSHVVVELLTDEGIERLDRCRKAKCGLIHTHNGAMVCVGRGKSCEWLSLWAAWLNSGRECPHWLTTGQHGSQHDRTEHDEDSAEKGESTPAAE